MTRGAARLWDIRGFRLGLVFVGVPALAFGIPAAAGVPWLVGDNLIQNYPLRALVGTDLAHGHLPLWAPQLWSGSPLLAGFNAGAAYPLSWLFAVLPNMLAWVTNQVAVEVVAAAGMAALLRGFGRSWTAAGLGAASFAYGGFVAVQDVHLDIVQAAGWLVWAFVALERLARRPPGRAGAPWVALLGVSLGLMVLTGGAEPILDGGVVLVLYSAWLLWRAAGHRLALAAEVVGGAAIGILIGAAQLLPGSALQGQSQRATHSLWYFTSGSINKSFTLLGLDPFVLGGAHSFPLSFVGTYNLPEISSYIGILPVMGVVGLLARRHRRHPEARQWWIWYAIGIVGLVLAWGDFTPLAHLEYLVPFYNRQRLLGRNLLEVDIAAAVLFAAWVDHMLLAPRPAHARDGSTRRWRSDVVLPLLPPLAVVGLQVVILAGGPWFPHFLHVPGPVSYGNLWRLGLFLTVPSALAIGAALLVVHGPRLGRRTAVLAAALVTADLLVFNVMGQVFPQPSTAAGDSVSADALAGAVAAAGTGPGGVEHRMALFDPDRFHPNEVDQIGQPDLNILRDLSSVQGYGAVVDARYDAATGAHEQGNLSIGALFNGTLQGLDLGVIVTVPEYFVHAVVAPPSVPNATIAGATPLPPLAADRSAPTSPLAAPPTPAIDYHDVGPPASTVSLTAGAARTWYFGTVLAVRSVALPVAAAPGATPGPARLRIGVLSPDGTRVDERRTIPVRLPATGTTELRVGFPDGPAAAGLEIEQTAGPALSIGAATVATAGQGTYRVDGSLRDWLSAPTWRFDGTIGVFAVFTTTKASGRAFLEPSGAGTARVLSSPPWGADRIEVHSDAPAVLVRDEAFATGWQATVAPAPGGHGPTRSVSVVAHGLVQSVRVPAGTHVVTFRYRAHRVVEGLAGSLAGVVLALGLVIVGRRGPGRGRRGAGAARAAARSARGPGGAAPGPAPSAPAPGAVGPPRRGP